MQALPEQRFELVQCPYDEAHLIWKYRLQKHLVACAKSHPNTKKLKCPFDATHIIEPAVYEHHINTCESSGNVWNHIYSTEPEVRPGTVPVEDACANEPLYMDEDWNGDYASYNPMNATENRSVTRVINGLSKAKRKAFRQRERDRINSLEKFANDTNVEPVRCKVESQGPLRQPKEIPLQKSKNTSISTNQDCSQIDNTLTSQFNASLNISGRRLNNSSSQNGKENVGDVMNKSMNYSLQDSDNDISFKKPTAVNNNSFVNSSKTAGESNSLERPKNEKLNHNNFLGAVKKNKTNLGSNTIGQINNSFPVYSGLRRPGIPLPNQSDSDLEKSQDSSFSDSENSSITKSRSESDSAPENSSNTKKLPRLRQLTSSHRPGRGRGLTILINEQSGKAKPPQ